jgi:hypothetical protein
MHIELIIDGNKKTFTAPFVPMMAKRKFLEVQVRAEEREKNPTSKELIEEDNEVMSILTDIIFQKQFTLDELFNGASQEYIDQKLREGVFGIKPKKESDEGNEKGE